jgi:hypothetical protein
MPASEPTPVIANVGFRTDARLRKPADDMSRDVLAKLIDPEILRSCSKRGRQPDSRAETQIYTT